MSGAENIALSRAISAKFGKFGGAVRVDHLARNEWASITFTGARHRLAIMLEGDGAVAAASEFLNGMAELDLPVPGHFVADIALLSEARRDDGRHACLEVEALTIEA